MNWQSIVSAPRNRPVLVTGTAVLHHEHGPVVWTGQAMWDHETGQWVSQCYNSVGTVLVIVPTHWIELPEI
jgi:hypothetical protein